MAILLMTFFLVIACQKENEALTDPEDQALDLTTQTENRLVDITSELEKYSLAMSSVPGLPIKISNLDSSKTYFISFETTDGEVVMWHDGQVSAPVTDYTMLKDEPLVVYWRPILKDETRDLDYELNVIVYGNDLAVALDRYTRVISLDEDLYYYLKPESD